ncbi:Calcium-binding protein 8 [Anabarilius grahami]|uniref:Calcium-binding protein 8 n=1 Tax=Anabarilius grahami TaxID=495550 RepID=A0A3N0YNB0_ANAGA|nr:Calcium-binding protein 8 [Anabarilius grahami]
MMVCDDGEMTREVSAEIREAFRVLDRDGNGFISKQELGMAMRSLGYMPSEVELAIIMQRLDMDGDGQVDFDEFMTILGPKLVSSETREGFLGSTIDSIFWQWVLANNNSPMTVCLMNEAKASPTPDPETSQPPTTPNTDIMPEPPADTEPETNNMSDQVCEPAMSSATVGVIVEFKGIEWSPAHTLVAESSVFHFLYQRQPVLHPHLCWFPSGSSSVCSTLLCGSVSGLLVSSSALTRGSLVSNSSCRACTPPQPVNQSAPPWLLPFLAPPRLVVQSAPPWLLPPSAHLSSLWLHWAASSVWLCLGQFSLCQHHGAPSGSALPPAPWLYLSRSSPQLCLGLQDIR